MLYQEDCPKCHGAGSEEFDAGLVIFDCEECNGTGKIPKAIPETPEGQYFCVQCETPHKEKSKVGKSHLQFKAEEA